jgi:hypothetical protein
MLDPNDIEPGEYLLSWKYDCEQSTQIRWDLECIAAFTFCRGKAAQTLQFNRSCDVAMWRRGVREAPHYGTPCTCTATKKGVCSRDPQSEGIHHQHETHHHHRILVMVMMLIMIMMTASAW